MDLKAETIGLAVALELPMIVIDVQRAGPSTGMPTKTEQSDLLMALYGRHGESPLPVIAPSTPGRMLRRRVRGGEIAVRYRTPVILLSDTFLASSSEPWRIPDVADLPEIDPAFARRAAARTRCSCPTRATSVWPGRGRSRDARPPAPDRRTREGRRTGQHLLRRRQPRADDRAAGGEGRRDRREIPPLDGRRRSRRAAARARLGFERGRDPRRRAPRAARRATRSRARTCATSTRCRRTPATCCARSTGCSCPR